MMTALASYLQEHVWCEPDEAKFSVVGKVSSHNLLAFSCLAHLKQHLHTVCNYVFAEVALQVTVPNSCLYTSIGECFCYKADLPLAAVQGFWLSIAVYTSCVSDHCPT